MGKDILNHRCTEHFIEDSLDRSGTQVVVKGHCEVCVYRMTIIYRYMGTYDRDTLEKIDNLTEAQGAAAQFKRNNERGGRLEPT